MKNVSTNVLALFALTVGLTLGCPSDDDNRDNNTAGTVGSGGAGGAGGPGGAGGEPQGPTRESVCEAWNALEVQLGCTVTPAQDCIVRTTCLVESAALVDCWAENPTGCVCEGDDWLNCEGTYNNERGPAELGTPCLEAADAYQACSPDQGEEEETSTSEAGEGTE